MWCLEPTPNATNYGFCEGELIFQFTYSWLIEKDTGTPVFLRNSIGRQDKKRKKLVSFSRSPYSYILSALFFFYKPR